MTASVKDALRLKCSAIGYTIYPGSHKANDMFEELRALSEEAKEAGLAVVVWSYPRGANLSKDGEMAVDVCAYAAHLAALLGAHIIKVKPPICASRSSARRPRKSTSSSIFPLRHWPSASRYVACATFGGRRIVIFSGGAAKGTQEILDEIKGIAAGGGNGSIIGRNTFQRPKAEALALLGSVVYIRRRATEQNRNRSTTFPIFNVAAIADSY